MIECSSGIVITRYNTHDGDDSPVIDVKVPLPYSYEATLSNMNRGWDNWPKVSHVHIYKMLSMMFPRRSSSRSGLSDHVEQLTEIHAPASDRGNLKK